ncbi:MAG: hypothetical protein HC880_16095, partial [Bacteroidia bacterium]|nr:hypothetical protein [Bacteroidia bacterium]
MAVNIEPQRGYLKVVVQDQGVGISPEALPTIWERFVRVRTEETKDIEGTGLGLAIVKSLVEIHGGQVGVESTEGAGVKPSGSACPWPKMCCMVAASILPPDRIT